MRKKLYLYFLSGVMISLIFSCGSLAPFQERKTAMSSIELAKSVRAEKYAPQPYNEALDTFDKGENKIVTNEKSKLNDEAKEQYIKSDQNAKEAYGIAIAPFTESFIIETDEKIQASREDKVHVASKDLYDEAVSLNEEAKKELANKTYEKAKEKTLSAREKIQAAIDETISLKEQVNLLEREFVDLLNEAQQSKAEAATPNEYKNLVTQYDDAKKKYQEGYYRDLLETYPFNITEVENLIRIIEEQKRLALQELEEATLVIDEVKEKNKSVEEEIKEINNLDQNSGQ